MLSVVIPALNESATIAATVARIGRHPEVGEVLVIDDGSVDGSGELARAAGARVLLSSMLGKGVSMADGVRAARHELVLFLDGDLSDFHPDLVPRMLQPLQAGTADLVKARFTRAAGRVTILTARPLLAIFFPELAGLQQPLGGIVAARREFLAQLRFESDYGADVGLLLDAAEHGARIVEVDIGHLQHESQPLERLGDMARQVVRVIMDRAARYGRLNRAQLQEGEELERRAQAERSTAAAHSGPVERLALFDMDGVLLDGRFALRLAETAGRRDQLEELLDRWELSFEERTRRIAALFAGLPRELFERTAGLMALMPGAAETVIALRKLGYRVGVVTDSFFVAADAVRRRVFADFSVANLLRFAGGRATGQVSLAPALESAAGCREHRHCKANVLHWLLEHLQLAPQQVLAVGDGRNDICLLRAAGTSVAFEPKDETVAAAAQHRVEYDLTRILPLIAPPVPNRA